MRETERDRHRLIKRREAETQRIREESVCSIFYSAILCTASMVLLSLAPSLLLE